MIGHQLPLVQLTFPGILFIIIIITLLLIDISITQSDKGKGGGRGALLGVGQKWGVTRFVESLCHYGGGEIRRCSRVERGVYRLI